MLKGRRLLILPEINQSIPKRLINKRLNESESWIMGLRIIAIIIISVQRGRRKPRKWAPLSLTTAAAGGASYRAHRSGIGRKAEGRSVGSEKDPELRAGNKESAGFAARVRLGKSSEKVFFSEGGAPCWCNFFTAAASCFLSRLQLRLFFCFSSPEDTAHAPSS